MTNYEKEWEISISVNFFYVSFEISTWRAWISPLGGVIQFYIIHILPLWFFLVWCLFGGWNGWFNVTFCKLESPKWVGSICWEIVLIVLLMWEDLCMEHGRREIIGFFACSTFFFADDFYFYFYLMTWSDDLHDSFHSNFRLHHWLGPEAFQNL